jgi:Ran GTPase-activating protein (RanGAP) involved in mRNA processing and transport
MSVAVIPTVVDPVEAAVKAILDGPLPAEQRSEVPEGSSPTRQRGDVSLDLAGGRHHFCDDEDVKRLAQAWLDAEVSPVHITSLDLSLNKVSDEGAKALIEALRQRPCRLSNLDLNSNDLTDATLKLVTGSLITGNQAPHFHRLDLSSNRITDDGVTALIQGVSGKKDVTLHSLLLRANRITNVGMAKICAWLEEDSCSLSSLHVSGNTFTEAILEDVATALRTNPRLTDLNLNNTMPKVSDINTFAEAAAKHPRLLVMPLAFDGKKRDHPAVIDAIKRNKLEVKLQSDFVFQMKAAHRDEISALLARVAQLEQQLSDRDGASKSNSSNKQNGNSASTAPHEETKEAPPAGNAPPESKNEAQPAQSENDKSEPRPQPID